MAVPAGGPPDAWEPGRRRRGRVRLFLGIALIPVLVGVVLLAVALSPGTFGLHRSPLLPFGGGFLGIILILWGTLFLVRVAWWSARRGPYGGRPGGGFDPAMMVARRRYARGEITREQYEQLVADLRRPPGPLP